MGSTKSKEVNMVKITSKDRAILDLKLQRDKLRQYKKQLQSIQDVEMEMAKKCLEKGDKQRALLALKKKKYQDILLQKCEDQIFTVEQLTSSIEFASIEQKVIQGLKQGTSVLKQLNDQVKLQDVDKLMDDTFDAIAYQKQVSEALSNVISPEEELEVEAELDKMLEEEEVKLPNVPKHQLPEVEKEESEVVKMDKEKSREEREEPLLA